MKQAIKSQKVFLSNQFQPATLLIKDGIITAIESWDYRSDSMVDDSIVDYGDLCILPGLVDTHVHINEPGRTDWEGFDTATHAAAAGGITTLVDMPLNCDPVTTTIAALGEKLAVLDNKLVIDTAFWGGATSDNLDDLDELLDAGILGVKSFTIDSGLAEFTQVDEAQLTASMRKVAKAGLVHLIHAEIDNGEQSDAAIGTQYQSYLKSRPDSFECDAIAMIIRVMETLKREGLDPKVHIVHLSAARALPMISKAKATGLSLTVETCPHYLVLEAETIPDGKTAFKCCPPIREKTNNDQLWAALLDGTIDCVVSDHSPCTPNLKHLDTGDLEAAWGGISGLQFGLPLMWTAAKNREFPLEKLVSLMTEAPAKTSGLTHGVITTGSEANFCIFDPECEWVITEDIIHHKHKVTPYKGKEVLGRVLATWLRGHCIYDDGNFYDEKFGKPILLNK